MPDPIDATTPAFDAGSPAFAELKRNLQYVRGLVQGGRSLQRLQVGVFEVTDLYRAAWVQAVSSLDHWVHQELYDRAVAIASQVSVPRPAKFRAIKVPMGMLEDVHHHSADLTEVFRAQLRQEFGRQTYQQPDDIKVGFSSVSESFTWAKVARSIPDKQVGDAQVKERLTRIAWRRNAIAHSSDTDPATGRRTPLSSEEAAEAIDWIERIAAAIVDVLGPVPSVEKPQKSAPAPRKRWSRRDIEAAASAAGPDVDKVVRELLDHGDRCGAKLNGGIGVAPAAGMYYPTRVTRRSLWSIYLTPDRPSLSLNLALVSGIDPAITRRFVTDLRRVPVLDDALIEDDESLVSRYPTVYLASLASADAAVAGLLEAFDGVVTGWS